MSGPRSTVAWQRARAEVIASESVCWICGASDFVRTSRHRRSASVDHVIALAVGGSLLERSNLRLAHLGCNSARGTGRGKPLAPRSERW